MVSMYRCVYLFKVQNIEKSMINFMENSTIERLKLHHNIIKH